MQTLRVRIVILNYNGEALLPQCLPSIVQAAKQASFPAAVTILDNLSQDKGLEYVRKEFPEVDIYLAPENKILCSYNEYLPKITEPVVILLNNDIRVDPGFIDPLLRRFQREPKTFLSAPCVMSFDGKNLEAGRTEGKMRWGLFWASAQFPEFEAQAKTPSETYSSGFGAFSREKFLELGGYDARFYPGIFEDIDLSHRARKKGYKLFYEPESVVYHMGQASFKKRFGARGISVMAHRNNFLFMWKNFRCPGFWLAHLFFLPLRLLFSLLKGDSSLTEGFFQALKRSEELKKKSCCPSA